MSDYSDESCEVTSHVTDESYETQRDDDSIRVESLANNTNIAMEVVESAENEELETLNTNKKVNVYLYII